jgi:hypothetical protein
MWRSIHRECIDALVMLYGGDEDFGLFAGERIAQRDCDGCAVEATGFVHAHG